MKPAAVKATYADLKLVRSRSCAQLVFEIPLEQLQIAIDAFGVPMPSAEVWCAIARLNPAEPDKPKHRGDQCDAVVHDEYPPDEDANPQKPARKWESLPLSQQAAIRCGEASFRRFLDEEGFCQPCETDEDAAGFVRTSCGVTSRANIRSGQPSGEHWLQLERHFQFWLRSAA